MKPKQFLTYYLLVMVVIEKYAQAVENIRDTENHQSSPAPVDLTKYGGMVARIESMERTCKDVKWDDIIRLDAIRRLLQNIFIEPMSNKAIFQGAYGKLTTSVLLHGPPGTGKTLLVKGLANHCKAKLYILKPSDILRKYVGESERIVECLFAVARANKPAIIFIDECDAIFADRALEGSGETMVSLKNQLLVEMDGFEEEPVPIIGATNRLDDIDAAFRRRLGRQIQIDLPNASDRRKIITMLLKLYGHHPNQDVKVDFTSVNVDELVIQTEGRSPADLVQLFKSAALEAAVSRKDNILTYTMDMFAI